MKKSLKLPLLFGIFLIVLAYFILELIFHEQWEKVNAEFVENWQGNTQSNAIKIITEILNVLVDDIFISILFLVLWISNTDKNKLLRLLTYSSFSLYLTSCLDMIYRRARPYMVYDNIEAIICQEGLGSPSGHSLNGPMMYFSLFYLFLNPLFYDRNREDKLNTKDKHKMSTKNKFICGAIWILMICLLLIMTIFRIYLGVHSFNQIILGWDYAFFLILIILSGFDGFLTHEYNIMLHNNQIQKHIQILILIIIFCIFLIIPTIIYLATYNNLSLPINLIYDNALNKCPEFKGEFFLAGYNYANAGNIALLFGVLFGIVLTSDIYGKAWNINIFNIKKYIVISIVSIVAFVVPFLVFHWVPSDISPYLNFFVKNVTKVFLMGFFLVTISPSIFKNLGWYQQFQ